jgi:hypothetical protein
MIGRIKWRLEKFEEARAKENAENEVVRIEQKAKDGVDREKRKTLRKKNKVKKESAMAMLRLLKGETLFI